MDQINDATGRQRDLTRVEAARYITDTWFPCAAKTLAKLAVTGGGPTFCKAGRIPLYARGDLDVWAKGRIGPRVKSTSELPPQIRPDYAEPGRGANYAHAVPDGSEVRTNQSDAMRALPAARSSS
jgi:hypothetical protein